MTPKAELYDTISKMLNEDNTTSSADKIEILLSILSAYALIVGGNNKKSGKRILKLYKNKTIDLLKNYDRNLEHFKSNLKKINEEIKID